MAEVLTTDGQEGQPRAERSTRERLVAILSYARPHLWALVAATGFLVLGSLGTLLYPQWIRDIVNAAIEEQDAAFIEQRIIALGFLFLGFGVAVGVRYYLFTWVGAQIVARLRQNLFQHLMGLKISLYDQERVGVLMSRLSTDTATIRNAASVNISMALRNGVQCVGSFILLWMTSPRLTGIMAMSIPPLAIGASLISRRLRRLSRGVQDALADASGQAEEALRSVRIVRSFDRELSHTQAYAEKIDSTLDAERRRIGWMAIFQMAMVSIGYATILMVMWVGISMVLQDQQRAASHPFTMGDLIAFLLYTLTVSTSLGALTGLWGNYASALGAADRVFDLLQTPSAPKRTTRPADFVPKIEFRNLSFAYPSRPQHQALKEIDLTMAAGEQVALVGRSGSGKSTVAALLLGHYEDYEGGLYLNGRALDTFDLSWYRSHLAVVSQEPTLFAASIADNIAYGLRLDAALTAEQRRTLIEEVAEKAHVTEFSDRFHDGLDTFVGERGVQLSGGQKQRVAIARAMIRNPRLLILDEATSALDAESEHWVQDALDTLIVGKTTLVIAHRLSTVRGADRVVVLDEGKIVQVGDHNSLMNDQEGVYHALVHYQLEV